MKKLALLIIFFAPLISHGAIAFDAAEGRIFTIATSVTYAHTVTGSNTVLFADQTIDFADDHTGCTYNSAAMTQIAKIQQPSAGRYSYMLYKVNPDTGTHNIVCTAGTSVLWLVFSSSFTGVNQSLSYTGGSPTDNVSTGTQASGTTLAASVTTIADNSWAIMHGAWGGGTVSAGANTTDAEPDDNTSAQFQVYGGPKTPAGSLTLNVSSTQDNYTNYIIASFSPPAAAAAATFNGGDDDYMNYLMESI